MVNDRKVDQEGGLRSISTDQLFEKLSRDRHLRLIDVRTPAEYRAAHVEGADNVPLDRLDPEKVAAEFAITSENPLFVICWSGNRSRKACDRFFAAGVTDVVNVEGGTRCWEEAGFPLARGGKMISLDRQVRIVNGLLIVLGVILGFKVHPGWFGLSAFVGAGLVLAGITDTCAMAILVSRMPWNSAERHGESCCSAEPETST